MRRGEWLGPQRVPAAVGAGCSCAQSLGAPASTGGGSPCLGSADCSPFCLPTPHLQRSSSRNSGQHVMESRVSTCSALPPWLCAWGSPGWGRVFVKGKSLLRSTSPAVPRRAVVGLVQHGEPGRENWLGLPPETPGRPVCMLSERGMCRAPMLPSFWLRTHGVRLPCVSQWRRCYERRGLCCSRQSRGPPWMILPPSSLELGC